MGIEIFSDSNPRVAHVLGDDTHLDSHFYTGGGALVA